MAKYRMKPSTEVEAIQLRWDTWSDMCKHAGVGKLADRKPEGVTLEEGRIGLYIPTPDGLMLAQENDWIITSELDDIEIYKPDEFERVYEAVT